MALQARRKLPNLFVVFALLGACSSSITTSGCANIPAVYANYQDVAEKALRDLDSAILHTVATGQALEILNTEIENFIEADVMPYVDYKELEVSVTECSTTEATAEILYQYRTNSFHRSTGELHYDSEWYYRQETVHFEKSDDQVWKVSLREVH